MSQRAEAEPLLSVTPREHKAPSLTKIQHLKITAAFISDWLPRPSWRVAPAIGIGLATPAANAILENFSGRTALVQAAGCENPILALNFMYAQDVRKNPDSLTITNESFVIPMDLPATFGPAEVSYKKNPDDPKETAKSYPIQLEMRGDHASGKTVVKEQPNKGNSLYLEYTFLDDAKDPKTGLTPRRPLVLACNEAGYFVGGRASTPDTIDRVVNNPSITGLSKVGDRSFELASEFMKAYKRRPAFTPPGAKPDENLKALKASVAEAIASYKRIKAEEAKRFGIDAAQKPADNIQAQLDQLKKDNEEKDKQIADLKSKIAEPSSQPKGDSGNEGGIRFPDLSKIGLPSGIYETPVLGGIVRGGEFVLDLPAKVVDKFTDPDTQAPLRWGINGLGWLLVWGPGFLGIPKTFSWNTVRFPERYIRNRMNLAGGGPGVPHPWPL